MSIRSTHYATLGRIGKQFDHLIISSSDHPIHPVPLFYQNVLPARQAHGRPLYRSKKINLKFIGTWNSKDKRSSSPAVPAVSAIKRQLRSPTKGRTSSSPTSTWK